MRFGPLTIYQKEEWGDYDEDVTGMLRCGDIIERERYITDPIWKEGFITQDDAKHLAEMAILPTSFC